MDAKVAEKLLQLLSTDDRFRKQFVDDPAKALEKVGHKDEDGLEPFAACSRVQNLASKEVIAGAHNELMDMLTAGLALTTPQLDAGDSNDPLRTLK
ncbi:putative modified peptide [Lysobacter terrestris]|uniref:Putative modified peptide n=2 Tax=Agrilutibacter terrestris TaxID=2865112 RepID=A0A7H0G1F6_9GAMM|nr:putative modified peptide [Lysobacter terrestris]